MNKLSFYFEKFSAAVFLIVLLAILIFLTYHPINNDSKDAVLMVVGALTAASTTALPKLFSHNDDTKNLKDEIRQIRAALDKEIVKRETLKRSYDDVIEKIVLYYMDQTTKNISKNKEE